MAIASSGVAATLLDGGITAHSALKLSLNIQNNPDAVCNIKTIVYGHSAHILDECTIGRKNSLGELDWSFRDIRNNDKLFYGPLLLLSGVHG